MNRLFRVVWNASTGAWQAVAEAAKGRGKTRSVKASVVALAAACIGTAGAWADGLPTQGQVVQGSGRISQSAKAMTIQQDSARMAIDWNSFSIGQGNKVQFLQPSASAVALNRVTGSDVSAIQGSLQANGQVFLVNPSGVLFSKDAQVNVGAMVASTLNISNADFMAGRYTFEGASSQSIVNRGQISASPGGTVALIAARISNDGTLTAEKGNVLLGAGSKVTLDMGGPVKLQIENDKLETLIQNGGAIKADGGVVWLTSQAASQLASSVINTGVIEAQTLATGEKGEVILFAHDGHMQVGGSIKAEGGFVETSGKTFAVTPGAEVKAGHWLIDPVNINIDSTLAGNISNALNAGGDVTISTAGSNTPSTASGESGTEGDITVSSSIAWNTAKTLTLHADRHILVNADIDGRGASGKLALEYGQAGSSSADYFMAYGKKIYLDAGSNFSTKLGSAAATTWTVITDLGAAGAQNTENPIGWATSLQGIGNMFEISGKYALGADIDASATSGWNAGAGFSPIGSPSGAKFNGWFNGLGHTITNLTINRPTTDGVGLFGVASGTDPNTTIRNLHLLGGSITGQDRVGAVVGAMPHEWPVYDNPILQISDVSSSATVSGRTQVGGLVGYMTSKYYSGTTSNTSMGSLITHSSSTGSVTGSGDYVGGLVGQIQADATRKVEVLYSYATGAVEGAKYVGGLIGAAGGGGGNKLQFSYATGNVKTTDGTTNGNVGGLIGESYTTISDSYATGNVTAAATGGAWNRAVGGFIGSHPDGAGTVTRSYSTGLVTNTGNSTYVNGFVGEIYTSSKVTNSYYDNTVNSALAASAGNVGISTANLKKLSTFSGWGSNIVEDSSLAAGSVYPQLRWTQTGLGVGTSAWVIGPSGTPVTYTFNTLTSTYTYSGNPYTLNNLWSAESLFGSTYSGWTLGTDYAFKHSGSAVTSFTNAGTYSGITVDILKSGFIAASSGNTAGSFTIAKAPLSVTANNVTTTYNGSAYTGTPGVTYSGFVTPTGGAAETSAVLGGALTYAYSTPSPTNAGSYTITPSGLTSNNYNITFNTGPLNIDKKALTVTGLAAAHKVYDGTASATLSGTPGLTGVVSSDAANVSLSGTASGLFVDAIVGSSKPVTIAGLSLAGSAKDNYTLSAPAGLAANITERPITVTATATSKTYGNADPALAVTVSATEGQGLVGGDTVADVAGTLSRQAGESVGRYNIALGTGAKAGNYSITFDAANQAFTIDPRAISLLATAASKIYGNTDPALGVTVSDTAGQGLASGDSVTDVAGTLSRQAGESVGRYKIALGTGAKASNYTITFDAANQAFTIDPRAIQLLATAASKTYGNTDPALAVTVSGTQGLGLANGDSLVDVSGTLSRQAGESVGSYNISLGTGAKAGNYTIMFDAANQAFIIDRDTKVDAVLQVTQSAVSVGTQPDVASSSIQARQLPTAASSDRGAQISQMVTPEINGGLAFIPVASTDGAQSSNSANVQRSADLSAHSGGRDPLGFMRVFVVRGGLNLPVAVSSTVDPVKVNESPR